MIPKPMANSPTDFLVGRTMNRSVLLLALLEALVRCLSFGVSEIPPKAQAKQAAGKSSAAFGCNRLLKPV
jgi:hypothetical protein